jgi:2-polyprenyl-3-methyl-5-hydroxy-6-metoxy-1,4-benzoquinol methylase
MEKINCIFCNKTNDHVIIQENGYNGIKCSQCGLIYVSPRPTLEEIVNLYGHDMAHASAKSHISSPFPKMLHAKHTLRIIRKFLRKGTILEIGAGAGYFLDEARKVKFEVYGIELNSILTDFVHNKLGIPCKDSSLETSLFGNKRYDIIYHCDVISHFNDPITEFCKINSMLNAKGLVIFETGNFGDVKEEYYKHFKKFQFPDHLFLFSENNIIQLLSKTGFEFIKIYRYSILPQLISNKFLENISCLLKPSVQTHKEDKIHGFTNSSLSPRNIFFNLYQFSKKAYIYAFNITYKYLYHCLSYFIRYKIGYITPKKGKPQTVIVIARKK